MPYGEVMIQSAATFFALLFLTRLMGRKQVSQFTFFNYAAGITIGSLAAATSINTKISPLLGLSAIAVWSFLTIVVDYFNFKFKFARLIIDGQPEVVIKDGKIMEKALGRLRLDMDELKLMLRNKKVFSIEDVDYAIMETNGQLSILCKEECLPVTKRDLNIKSSGRKFVKIPTEIVLKGKVIKRNLKNLDLPGNWLEEQLEKANVDTISNVYYAEIQPDGTLYIDKRNDQGIS